MKNVSEPLRFVWMFGALLGTGCPETQPPVRPDPPPSSSYVALVPVDSSSNIPFITNDRVVVGIVGRKIGREQFTTTLPVPGPAEIRCQVSFHRLSVPQTDRSEETLNFDIKDLKLSANERDWNCSETPSPGHKDVTCLFERAGVARIRLESANPNMALGFGFLCSQKPREAAAQTPAVKKLRPPGRTTSPREDPANSTVATSTTSEPAQPAAEALVKQLIGASEGRDDKHKVLTLSPCKEPLSLTKGTATFAKLRRSFTVVSSKGCEIEVADVPDSVLESGDTSIKLSR